MNPRKMKLTRLPKTEMGQQATLPGSYASNLYTLLLVIQRSPSWSCTNAAIEAIDKLQAMVAEEQERLEYEERNNPPQVESL
jgi:hypothetical protein